MAQRPGSGGDAEGQGADIFISYQRDNAAHAKRLAAALRRDNRNVWLDQKLSSDKRWRAEIEGKLKRARCIVAIWSKKAATSGWVNYEAFRAQQEDKLVAVTFDPIKADELPEWLADQQITSLRDWKSPDQIHNGWLNVARTVSAKCNQLPDYKFKGWLGGGPVHERVTHLAFHPTEDGRLLSSGSEGRASLWLTSKANTGGRGSFDAEGAAARALQQEHDAEGSYTAPASGNEYYKTSIWRAQYSKDGDRIVLACRDGVARVFDRTMQQLICELRHNASCGIAEMAFANKVGGQHRDGVWDACFLPDGDIVTVGGSRVATWTPEGNPRHPRPLQLREGAHAMATRAMHCDVVDGVIVGDKLGKVRIIDAKTNEDAFQIDDRFDTFVQFALGPKFVEGQIRQGLLAVVSESPLDSEIKFHDWGPGTGAFSKPRPHTILDDAPPVRSVALHPRAPVIAVASSAVQPRLHDHSAHEAIPLPRDGWHDRGITSVAFSATGRFLAAGSEDGRISVWEDRSQPF
jgi:WD40 repeat protein